MGPPSSPGPPSLLPAPIGFGDAESAALRREGKQADAGKASVRKPTSGLKLRAIHLLDCLRPLLQRCKRRVGGPPVGLCCIRVVLESHEGKRPRSCGERCSDSDVYNDASPPVREPFAWNEHISDVAKPKRAWQPPSTDGRLGLTEFQFAQVTSRKTCGVLQLSSSRGSVQ